LSLEKQLESAAGLKGKKGLVRLWNALGYSSEGLAAAWRNEAAFRQELLLAVIAIPLAFYLAKSGVERALMVGSIILVLIVEILNSGLEAVVDKASPEKHELAKRAKDMGSAAVLLSLLNAATIWACLLWPV
jgi:diacylglycerol kinase (ATP)